MIYYNSNTINEWNYGSDNIVKVYRNNAVCYYKITGGGDTPTAQTPCFAVVNDISQYSYTEFEDVFNKADEKWYKLNNLNQYEEYGVYGSGRNITYYEGKLTIDGDYEYQYSGGSWVNLGEVSGGTYIEYLERDSSHNGYVPLGEYFQTNTRIQIDFQLTNTDGFAVVGDYFNNDNDDWRFFLGAHATSDKQVMYDFDRSRIKVALESNFLRYNWEVGNYYIKDLNTDNIIVSGTPHTNFSRPNQMYLFNLVGTIPQQNLDYGHIYSVKIYQNNVLVKDYIPWTDGNGNYGLYDNVSSSVTQSIGSMTGATGGTVEYPIYYDEMQDPPNNVSFSSMTEAEEYECPWVGMTVSIDGDKYIFSGDSTSGYEWVYQSSRLPQGYTEVEYIENTGTTTSNGAYLNLGLPLYNTIGNSFQISSRLKSEFYSASGYDDLETIINSESVSSPYYGFVYRYAHSNHNIELSSNPSNHTTLSTTANTDGTTSLTISCNSTSVTDQVPLGLFASYNANYNTPYRFAKATIYSLTVVKNGDTVRDLVPAKRDIDAKYGLYDLITDTFYTSPNGNNFIGGDPV